MVECGKTATSEPSAAGYDDRIGENICLGVGGYVSLFTVPFGGCFLRLNYRVLCIVVHTAQRLKAHHYNQITLVVPLCSVGVHVSPANTGSSRRTLAVLFVDSNVLQ